MAGEPLSIEADLETIIERLTSIRDNPAGSTDVTGIESRITTTNDKLAAIDALIAITNALLGGTLEVSANELEVLIAATNALLAGTLLVDDTGTRTRLDSIISLLANNAPSVHVQGVVTAPAINTVIGDTLALPAGNYELICHGGAADTIAVGKGLVFEHRNAANGATLHSRMIPASTNGEWRIPRMPILINERVRGINLVAGAAASRYHADIYMRLI